MHDPGKPQIYRASCWVGSVVRECALDLFCGKDSNEPEPETKAATFEYIYVKTNTNTY